MIDLGDYLLDADKRSLTLYRKHIIQKGDKAGEMRTEEVGHYTSLFNVAVKLTALSAHEAIAAGAPVPEIIEAMERSASTILQALEAAQPGGSS